MSNGKMSTSRVEAFSDGVIAIIVWIELVREHRHDPEMSEYHARVQLKNLFSAFLYLSAGALAHVSIYISYSVYVLIPVVYFLPERKLAEQPE